MINFICIGPGRTGTTWLYELFENHNEILLPKIKETEYFNNNFHKGEEWYFDLFPKNIKNKCIGEISNMYYCDIDALRRISVKYPNIKIIMSIRDPHDLLISYLKFAQRRGVEISSYSDINNIKIGEIMGSGFDFRLKNKILSKGDNVNLIDSVLLSKYISILYELFKKENIHFFKFADLVDDADMAAQKIFSFLNISKPSGSFEYKKVINQSAKARNPMLGRFAASAAFYLRRIGLFTLLNTLKNSNFVKSIFLTELKSLDFNFDIELKAILNSESLKISELIEK